MVLGIIIIMACVVFGFSAGFILCAYMCHRTESKRIDEIEKLKATEKLWHLRLKDLKTKHQEMKCQRNHLLAAYKVASDILDAAIKRKY